MRSGVTGVIAALAAAVLTAGGAGAHHGWSGYDAKQPLTLTGTIRGSGYEHPHGHLTLEVPGKVWHVVLAPPSRMERRGLAAAALAPGGTATVVGYPHRTEPGELRAERITIGDTTVELR
jgi:hypothetical protein